MRHPARLTPMRACVAGLRNSRVSLVKHRSRHDVKTQLNGRHNDVTGTYQDQSGNCPLKHPLLPNLRVSDDPPGAAACA
jgi:hypothetical protein